MLNLKKLKIWQKLTLIIAVMGIPFVTLAVLLFSSARTQIRTAEDELAGTEFLKVTRDLLEHVPQHAATVAAVAAGDSSFRGPAQTSASAIDNDLARLEEVNRQRGTGWGLDTKINALKTEWANVRGRGDGGDARGNETRHAALMDQVTTLIRDVADKSQLILDPDLESYYLMSTIVLELPKAVDELGRARTVAMGAGKGLTDTQRVQLSTALTSVRGELSTLQRNVSISAAINPAVQAKMPAAVSAAINTVESFLRYAGDGVTPGRDYYDRSNQASAELLRLYEPASELLSTALQGRISRLSNDNTVRIMTGFMVLFGALFLAYYVYKNIDGQISQLSELFSKLRQGEFEARVNIDSNDELGEMANGMNSMLDQVTTLIQSRDERDQIQTSIRRLLEEVSGVADGDLSAEAEVTADMTGAIADSFNFMIVELRGIIGDVQRTSQVVSASAAQIRETAEHLASGSEEQSEQILAASSAIEQMSSSIQKVSQKATLAADVAGKARESARQGAETVTKTIGGMEGIRQQVQQTAKRIKRLGESSQEIGEIVDLISDIADRTSILALNASIQAAMAGEAGKGFAVVAEEVERLAERSTEATKKISGLIKSIQTDTNEAISAMEETTQEVVGGSRSADEAGRRLAEIESVSNQLAEIISNIATASQQQAKGSESIARSVADISTVTQQTATGAKQAAGSISELAGMANGLSESMSRFRLPASA
ncbi:MAG: methyl-accepting chemotaxis protein [Bryobacterales bacterium]|nr:methyl-accepting chemotaxis protein [Bryobacterales bacterium]